MQSKFRPSVEVLEGREAPAVASAPTFVPIASPIAPSVGAMMPSAPSVQSPPAAPGAQPAPSSQKFFAGYGSGSYLSSLKVMNTPSGFHFTGTATINGMGKVDVYVHLYSVGFKLKGNAKGEMTLTNSKGSITLSLIGPEQNKLAALPSTFSFQVTKVTGAYGNVREKGTVRITRTIDALPIKNGIKYFETGKYTLVM